MLHLKLFAVTNEVHYCMYNLQSLHALLLHLNNPCLATFLLGLSKQAFESLRRIFSGCLYASTNLLFSKSFFTFSS